MNEYLIKALKEGRARKGLKQSDVAALLGVKGGTLSNYENGISEPDIDTFAMLCEIYDLDFAFVLSEAYGLSVQGEDFKIRPSEMEVAKKYRSLDDPGRSHVDTVLKWEADRMKQIEQVPAAIIELQNGSSEKGRLIDYYRSVSAGSGEVIFDDVYFERITLPDIPKYRRVAYAVKVDGRSMEPLYNDGDILLIEPTCEVEVGEIGIFNVDGKAYVKKLGKEKLISLNKGYGDIQLTEDSLCMGRVVGKLESIEKS